MGSGEVKLSSMNSVNSVNTYLFKINNRNSRRRREICSSKLTIKTPGLRHWRPSDVVIVNFEHISPWDFTPFSSVSIVDFEHVNVGWKVADEISKH